VHVHALEADGSWMHTASFPFATSDETPTLCTSLAMRGQRLFCAYSTGQVRVYDLISCSLQTSITAHARWINALQVHPARDDLFATASEDSTIGVWKCLEPEGKVVHCAHIGVTDWLLSGVAFVGGGSDKTHLATTAYDQAAIMSVKIDKI